MARRYTLLNVYSKAVIICTTFTGENFSISKHLWMYVLVVHAINKTMGGHSLINLLIFVMEM
jgi:hypothetical protein